MAVVRNRRNLPDIYFETLKGTSVKLSFDREYKAFRLVEKKYEPMMLGGLDPDALKDYIIKKY